MPNYVTLTGFVFVPQPLEFVHLLYFLFQMHHLEGPVMQVVRINVLILRQTVCLMRQNIFVLVRMATMMTMDLPGVEIAKEVG